MQQIDPVSSVMFLREQEHYHPNLVGIYFVEGDLAEGGSVLTNLILTRLSQSPAFSALIAPTPLQLDHPYWVTASEVSAERHITFQRVQGAGDWNALRTQLVAFAEEPFDLARPLWEVTVYRGFRDDKVPGAAAAIAVKVHHGVLDGLGLAKFAGQLFDLQPQSPSERRPRGIMTAGSPTETGPRRAVSFGRTARGALTRLLNLPAEVRSMRQLQRAYEKSVASGERPRLRKVAPSTIFNAPTRAHRVFDAEWFPLEDIQNLRTLVPGATVNDVALTIIAGALRSYLAAESALPADSLLCGVPMSLRDNDDPALGNTLTGLCVDLYTTVSDPVERMRLISAASYWEKQRVRQYGAVIGAGAVAIQLPPALLRKILRSEERLAAEGSTVTGANVVATNIPRDARVGYFGHNRVVRTCGSVSLNPGIGLKHEISSLNGELSISVLANADQLRRPEQYMAALRDEFSLLRNHRFAHSSAN